MTVVQFTKEFERCKEAENWNDRQALQWLKLALTGIARQELDSQQNISDYKEAKQTFYERFLTQEDSHRAEDPLESFVSNEYYIVKWVLYCEQML